MGRPRDEKTKYSGITKRWHKDANGNWAPIYRAQVRLRGYKNTSCSFPKLSDARNWKTATETSMRLGEWKDPRDKELQLDGDTPVTLREGIKLFEDDFFAEAYISARAEKNFKKEISNLHVVLEYEIADKQMKEITANDFRWLEDSLIMTRHIAANTVHNKIIAISRVFSWFINEEHNRHYGINLNPTIYKKSKSKKRVKNVRTRILTGEEEYIFAQHDFFLILMETALRRGELAECRWGDVDLREKTIFVPAENAKNRVSRETIITPAVELVLKKMLYVNDVPKNKIDRASHRLFTEHPDTWTKRFGKICKKYDFYDLRLHDLRRTAITKLCKNPNLSVMEVSEISGHKDIKMLHTYTNLEAKDISSKVYAGKLRDNLYKNIHDRMKRKNGELLELMEYAERDEFDNNLAAQEIEKERREKFEQMSEEERLTPPF